LSGLLRPRGQLLLIARQRMALNSARTTNGRFDPLKVDVTLR